MRQPARQFVGKQGETVDAYIRAAPKSAQSKLREFRAVIKDIAPTAKESISYQMPFYDYKGKLVWFGLQRGYIGLYLRPPVIAEHKRELAKYVTTKSAVHFPLDKKPPIPLIKKLVKARMKKNESEE